MPQLSIYCTGQTDGRTDGHKTDALRLPLDAANVKTYAYENIKQNFLKNLRI